MFGVVTELFDFFSDDEFISGVTDVMGDDDEFGAASDDVTVTGSGTRLPVLLLWSFACCNIV